MSYCGLTATSTFPTRGGNMVWGSRDPKAKKHIVKIQPQGRFRTDQGFLHKGYYLYYPTPSKFTAV